MTDAPKPRQMIAKYQAVFSNPLAVDVLEDMAKDCHFGVMIAANETQVALHNYFERLLSIIRGGDGTQQQSYVRDVLSSPIDIRMKEKQNDGN